MAEPTDWLRVRGMGRERFAGYLAEFLATAGFTVERTELADPPESRVGARLKRMNPAVPDSAAELAFRIYPTSGGAAVEWVRPAAVPDADRSRMDRFVREFALHVERAVLTESHATAKVSRAPNARLPWEPARSGAGAPGSPL